MQPNSNMSPNRTVISHFGPHYRGVEVGEIMIIADDEPFIFDCGAKIGSLPIAYQTYGTLNAEKSNAILVCHGLTGDQYVRGPHPVTGKPGWWEEVVGPGLTIDTNQFFVIGTNVIGGCMGSFGPKHINPITGKAYGLDFPVLTISDMVRAQAMLLDKLGIKKLFAVVGGSMGGMLVLEWAARFPERVFAAVPIATSTRHSAQNIAFHEIGRQAITVDPDWCDGRYYEEKKVPAKGLSVARMAAHVTYLSENAFQRKFGRNLQNKERVSYGFEADFQVESYLRHQGTSFVERFDACSYFYITRAMDYFDLAQEFGGLSNIFKECKTRFCVISFSSDWLFPTSESREVVRALNGVAANVSFTEVETDKGHDAFLLDVPEFKITLKGFLEGAASVRRID